MVGNVLLRGAERDWASGTLLRSNFREAAAEVRKVRPPGLLTNARHQIGEATIRWEDGI